MHGEQNVKIYTNVYCVFSFFDVLKGRVLVTETDSGRGFFFVKASPTPPPPPPKKNPVRRAGKKYFSFTVEELLVSVAREYFANNVGDLSIFSR